jgi:DNA-binding PadR family transcriptional regulator
MITPSVTRLGYALLGLLGLQPRSGYALRRVFDETPMGNYSSSPGSIYPALRSLERAGLVERGPAPGGKSHYALTSAGRQALDGWLDAPDDAEELVRHLDLALLRFAFLQQCNDPDRTDRFLVALRFALNRHAEALRDFLESESGRALPLQARLAVEHGQRTARASADWAKDARERLRVKNLKEEE